MYYDRSLKHEILKHLEYFPSVVILGARQVGKTTLVKMISKSIQRDTLYLDLELDSDINRLSEPEMFFNLNKSKCLIIDEVQRMPHLFPLLPSIIDQDRTAGRFILLGSANTHVLKLSSESLAGRVSYTELTGFLLEEVSDRNQMFDLWFRGMFPEAFQMMENEIRTIWFNSFVRTITERDLPQLGLKISSAIVSRFIRMIASNQGGIVNKRNLSNSLDISNAQVTEILDFFEAIFIIRKLEPYFINIGKRLVKSPKVYIRDSGLVHFMNGLQDMNALMGSQLAGSSWEGFCIEQIIGSLGDKFSYFFYRTQDLAECDLVICKGDKPVVCVEVKLSSTPKRSRSFTQVINDLGTDDNFILIPECATEYPLSENILVTDNAKLIVRLKNY
ncbi:MAG: ATP-binding protein [Bacteroidales bacterium]|nr:ATP-binding protein [Bacteroidales bacterium]MCF8454900.1 ATP-binding protein [Bacteroidales bacterium]